MLNIKSKKLLVCFWGQDKISKHLKNSPYMKEDYHENKIISLEHLVENQKNIFSSFDVDFLWSTWSRCNIEKYCKNFKYILKHEEPIDFHQYLDSIDFKYVVQIRDREARKERQGYYTQFFHKDSIIRFIKHNNIRYDGIVFSRSDIFFVPEKTESINFDKQVVYVPEIYWNSRGCGINDHIALGNFDYVIKAIDFYDFKNLNNIIQDSWNPELVNKIIIEKNNCLIEEFVCERYCRFPNPMTL